MANATVGLSPSSRRYASKSVEEEDRNRGWHHRWSTEGGRISNALKPRYRHLSTYHAGRITVRGAGEYQNPWKRSVGYQHVRVPFLMETGV